MEVTVTATQEEQEQQQQQHELVQQLKFPPGYHFMPTDSELVNYLRLKIEGRELPLHVVNEVNVLDWQPGSLVEAYMGYGEKKWYFFTVREPSSSNKEEEPNRKVRTPPGIKATWKATGKVVLIPAKGGGEKVVMGSKRVLIYHSSDAEEHGKWSMHEYILNGHAKIGQYALCSIQRKQHSDTMDDSAGEEDMDSSSINSQRNKRTKASNVDPEKKTKRKQRTTTNKQSASASTQSKAVQPQQQQGTTPVEPPLTPPEQAPPRASQQEQTAPASYIAPVDLPAAPLLHGYMSLSYSDGMLGSPAPLHEQGTPSLSFHCGDDDVKFGSFELGSIMMLCGQEEQPPSFKVIADSNAQYQVYQQQDDYCNVSAIHNNQQLYTEQQYFPSNSIQNNSSSWMMHGQHQNYQQEIGGACFGAQEQQHAAQAGRAPGRRNDGAVVLAGGYVRRSDGDEPADGVPDQKDAYTAAEDEDRWRWTDTSTGTA